MREYAWAKAPELISENTVKYTETADVVIIGAGHAGTCAARAAAEAGASVLVMVVCGGNTKKFCNI